MTLQPDPFAAQPPSNRPLPSPQPQAWTSPALVLVVLMLLIGAAAVLYSLAANPLPGVPESIITRSNAYQQALLVLNLIRFAVCLVGLVLARNALLRAGLVLQALVTLWPLVLNGPLVIITSYPNLMPHWLGSFYATFVYDYAPPVTPLINLATDLLVLLSMIAFSFVLARWQPSDKLFLWVQIVVTLGLGLTLLQTNLIPLSTLSGKLLLILGPFLSVAGWVCLLLRPACWKANPLIVLCLTLGSVLLFLYDTAIDHFFPVTGTQEPFLLAVFALNLVTITLLTLGLLLLIQSTRRQQRPVGP